MIGVCVEVQRVDSQELNQDAKFSTHKERYDSFKINEKDSMSKELTPAKDMESVKTSEEYITSKESTPVESNVASL